MAEKEKEKAEIIPKGRTALSDCLPESCKIHLARPGISSKTRLEAAPSLYDVVVSRPCKGDSLFSERNL